jgi:hypothetical protein
VKKHSFASILIVLATDARKKKHWMTIDLLHEGEIAGNNEMIIIGLEGTLG